ncbi:MAG: bifunctional alpha,alpha-trehalose-phosphate synthase (UDP-forming)/trehalose-phosphatase [Elusimicrobia bacterium]|nr:bifunctional alpha,alpha-trehalose-phosphate synthase (UDP-forming)/trehalose-phosphatase [Elusimicrobiota bacterium]
MRLLIVSNRLPFSVEETGGKISFRESTGGLVTGISAYLDSLKSSSFTKQEHIWVGWPGSEISPKLENELKKKALSEFNASPVFIDEKSMDFFYNGFCNKTIWPLFHCFPVYTSYNETSWNYYKKVNEQFCEAIVKIVKPDDLIWVHDYHLMLLPKLLKEKLPDTPVGFFLHIPFPPIEIFRLLPKKWRLEILKGLIGADLLGFHTHDYTQNFLKCTLRLLGFDHNMGNITTDNRILKADTFPMGIHYQKYHDTANLPEVQQEKEKLKTTFAGLKTILSVDRLDYTKGILNRLEGYELFLENNPQWHKKVLMLLVVVPSRIGIDNYQKMKAKLDAYVGKINGKFGSLDWTPVHYQYKYLPLQPLVALYSSCDVAMITPLRDGMNLVAKEYIAALTDKTGVLILSEMAGAAKELGEAIVINPNHKEEIADALKEALEMPVEQQKLRNSVMQKRLKEYDVIRWANDFTQELTEMNEYKKKFNARLLNSSDKKQLVKSFKEADSRIVFMDYDGTLVPFAGLPENAYPDEEILRLLKSFSQSPNTKVVIVSGRDKQTLQNWLGNTSVDMVSEHGVWIKDNGNDWQLLKPMNSDWKPKIIPILKTYSDRLSGSFVEEKEFSVVWHYRRSDPELASIRAKELMDDLISFTANIDVQVLQGNKVIEVRNSGINKGIAANYFLSKNNYSFIMALGDDWTDEDLFKSLPDNAYSFKVGITSSHAKYNIRDYKEARKLIEDLIK